MQIPVSVETGIYLSDNGYCDDHERESACVSSTQVERRVIHSNVTLICPNFARVGLGFK